MHNFKTLASLCSCAGWYVHDLVRNPKDRFSGDEAHFKVTYRTLLSCTILRILFFLQKLERSYNILGKLTSGLSERETNDVLNAHVGILQKQEELIDFYM